MIVITGAAGFVGNVLTKQLVENGEKVKAIVTKTDNLKSLEDLNVEIIIGDVRDETFLEETFSGARTVYHLAGIISITSGQSDLIEEVNIGGTQNVIDACLKGNVSKLIYMSSVHALKEWPHGKLIDETAPIAPDDVIGDYAKSKARATLAVKESIKQGLKAIVVYPSGIIGPSSYTVSNMGQLLIDFSKGRIPILIEGTYDFVDVRDVVSGTIAASKQGEAGDDYILSGYQITLKQLFSIISNLTGQKMPKVFLPNWLLKWFIPLSNFMAKRAKKSPTLTSYALYSLASNSLFSHEKANAELGYHPRHITRTIEDTLNWYKEIEKI